MKKKIFSAIIVVLTVLSMLPLQVFAVKDCSLKIFCKWNDNGIANEKVNIYRLADYNKDGKIVLGGDFKNYRAYMDSATAESLRISAYTVYAYANVNNIVPLKSTVTSENGLADFGVLPKGAYLVVIEDGKNPDRDGTVFTFSPFIVFLPDIDTGKYDVEAYPKATLIKDYEGTFTDIEVVKSWRDKQNNALRPKEVTVSLFCDGEFAYKCKLNKENNWRYIWKNLDASKNWVIMEDNISKYYSVTIDEKEDFRFSLTNVLTDIPKKEPIPEKLPQTGLLWWPVPVLFVMGALFISLGIVLRKKNEEA